ncbi:hypothetical protein DSL72_007378 [Monilinia vaccinii-corymbosi]|uniref:Uncharacterized protein n=1 Tax=Monilinia vaccinii-corymbosi TaxID=61207 RepID=A0A8A3PLG3_9HELO|nr:hypothetical protein DSL72_007378 [Monilinia vaccinii-corymbosi]
MLFSRDFVMLVAFATTGAVAAPFAEAQPAEYTPLVPVTRLPGPPAKRDGVRFADPEPTFTTAINLIPGPPGKRNAAPLDPFDQDYHYPPAPYTPPTPAPAARRDDRNDHKYKNLARASIIATKAKRDGYGQYYNYGDYGNIPTATPTAAPNY